MLGGMSHPQASLLKALRLRCPVCGYKPVTENFGEMVETCPGCGHTYGNGEDGYYVGALIINMAVSMITFVVTIGLVLAVTWPDVPWTAMTYILITVMILVPVFFYPRSKTVWIWLDMQVLNRSSADNQ